MTAERNAQQTGGDGVASVPVDERAVHIAYRLFNAPRAEWPYPHACFADALPEDLFAALRALNLADLDHDVRAPVTGVAAAEAHRFTVNVTPESIRDGAPLHPLIRYVYDVLSHPICVHALSRVFAREVASAFGRSDLPLASTMLMVEDRTGYALLPHTDVPHKAVTLLIYLAEEGDDPDLGTEIYIPAPGVSLSGGFPMRGRFRRSPFLRVATAAYRPNGALMFPPSARSFHGVKEVVGENRVRRLLQFQLMVDDPAIRRVDDTRGATA